MKFELARMILLRRGQADVFERRDDDGKELTREDWLRAIFSERREFIHRRADRAYVPDMGRPRPKGQIVGRIGRRGLVIENDPDNYLAEIEREQWKACLIIIDITDHPDGQKVAIEANSGVGQGFGNFESLVSSINAMTPPEPYEISVNKITSEQNFWDYVAENKGNITSITVDVSVPNIWGLGGGSSYEDEVRAVRDKMKAKRLKSTVESDEGLDVDTDGVRETVTYATRGGGRVTAKAKNAAPYDSSDNQEYMNVDVEKDAKSAELKADRAVSAFNQLGNESKDKDEE